MAIDFKPTSMTYTPQHFSVPKDDRGLLTEKYFKKTQRLPGPGYYEDHLQALKTKFKDGMFKMPQASRDISFSKYGSEHTELVRKGLY